MYGKSTVRILDPNTAEIIKSVKIPGEVFGEGMTYRKGKLYQITWKSHRGFIYNATTLDLLEEFEFHTTRNEGWGITWDPCEKEFVVTDGSANLHFWDKEKLTEKRTVLVKRMDGSEARELNEIEWYRGKILANVWFQDVLLVIDPITGIVEKEYGTFGYLILYCSICTIFHSLSVTFHVWYFRFQCSFSKERTNSVEMRCLQWNLSVK